MFYRKVDVDLRSKARVTFMNILEGYLSFKGHFNELK